MPTKPEAISSVMTVHAMMSGRSDLPACCGMRYTSVALLDPVAELLLLLPPPDTVELLGNVELDHVVLLDAIFAYASGRRLSPGTLRPDRPLDGGVS